MKTKIICFLMFQMFAFGAFSQDFQQYFDNGEAKTRQADYEGAIIEYSKSIKANPEFMNAYLKRAFSYGLVNNYELALADYSVVIENEPNQIYSYQSRGSAHNKLGHYQEAMADFNKVISLDSKNQEAYNNRGFVKKNLGDLKGACEDWYTSKKMGNDEAKIIIKNNHCK